MTTRRMYGVYYRNSIYQLWQFYVGNDNQSMSIADARQYSAAHPSVDVMVATYPEGYPESWRSIRWQYNGADHKSDPINASAAGIVNARQADWF